MNNEMQKIYEKLNEENKNVLNLVAKGIEIGQEHAKIQKEDE